MTDGLEILNGVLIGRESELYLAQGNHNPIDYFLGKKKVDQESIDNFWKNIGGRSEFCLENNATYRHVVFPDKHVVEYENFPLGKVSGLFENYRKEVGINDVVYPLEKLRGASAQTFHRDDTHMNVLGVRVALFEVLKSIFPQLEEMEFFESLSALIKLKTCIGDLSSKLGGGAREVEVFSACEGIRVFSNGVKGGNNGIVDIYINESARYPGKILIFGDSFLRGMLPAISCYFEKVLFLRTPFFHYEMFSMFSPEYVVTGNVERYLSKVRSDRDAPPFFSYRYGSSSYDLESETIGFSELYFSMLRNRH